MCLTELAILFYFSLSLQSHICFTTPFVPCLAKSIARRDLREHFFSESILG